MSQLHNPMMAPTTDPIVVGNTVQFVGVFKRNGAAWDLAGCTATLLLKKPDGTLLTKTASIANGQASYTSLTSDLDTQGDWERAWRITGSGIRLTSKGKPFNVQPALDG